MSAHLSRMQINEILRVVELVTSTSRMTARGTSTASYSTAALPTFEISTACNTISSVNTPMPGTAMTHQGEPHLLWRLPHSISVAPELQRYWTSKANRWQMSTLGVQYVETITTPHRDIAPEASPRHGVSSTQPTPLNTMPSASVAAPSGTVSQRQQATTSGSRNTLSVHEGLYADGWNNRIE